MRAIWARAVDHSTLSLSILFAVTGLLLVLAGCTFDSINLPTWKQIADVDLLRHDLWNTLWYLHSQPPLFNLMIGLALKAGDQAFPWIMGTLFALATLAGILSFNRLAAVFTRRPGIALAAAIWLCISPATLLFSTKLYYDSLLPGLFCTAFLCMYEGLERKSIPWLSAGFSLLAAAVLLRSMVHPLFYVLTIGVVLALCWGERRRILIAAIAPTLAIALVMIKNAIVFGFLGLSSWGPLNASQQLADGLPAPLKTELIASGKMSRLMEVQAFSPIRVYLHLMPLPAPTGHPSLDNVQRSTGATNYNHAIYLKIAAIRGHDAVVAFRAMPVRPLLVFAKSFVFFNRPSSDFDGLDQNRARIAGWNRLAKAVVMLQPLAWIEPGVGDFRKAPWLGIGYEILFGTLCYLVALCAYARRLWQLVRHRDRVRSGEAVFAAVLAFSFMLFIVSSVFDSGENNRAHYAFGPLMMLGVLWVLFGRKQFPVAARSDPASAAARPPAA